VVEVDLSTVDGPAQLVAAAGDRIDVLVNNVGAAPPRLDGFLAVTDDMWLATINLDLMAAVRATRSVLPVMLAAGGGVIVNIGSLNARLPDPTVVDYSAFKAALVNFAKSLSKEFGRQGIRVNTVDLGPVATNLSSAAVWSPRSELLPATGSGAAAHPVDQAVLGHAVLREFLHDPFDVDGVRKRQDAALLFRRQPRSLEDGEHVLAGNHLHVRPIHPSMPTRGSTRERDRGN
jgi:NAD(P)-dependent dehydrogenase (short-subunit alcohol dehydrogenase family)